VAAIGAGESVKIGESGSKTLPKENAFAENS
jgi:hypothetical protein